MQIPFPIIVYRAVGIGAGVLLMEILGQTAGVPYAQIPFITSIVLAIGLPGTPASTPRAIIGGHLVSTLAGILVLQVAGSGDFASALAVGLAALAMAATRTMHPPAGLDAFLVVSQSLPAAWLAVPVFPGAVMLALLAVIWSRLGDRLFRPPQTEPESDLANLRRPHLREPNQG